MQARAQAEMDGKAKPPGSLGTLEDIAIKVAMLQKTMKPSIDDAVLLIFAADHGFTKSNPGVSAYPREVSTSVFHCIANGDAASAVLCKENNCRLTLIDVGLDASFCNGLDRLTTDKNSHVEIYPYGKTGTGSNDFLQGPAMSEDDVQDMNLVGRTVTLSTIKSSNAPRKLAIGIGELGIGNTTSASAIVCAITGHSPELVCGRGSGVDDAGLALKISTVKAALETNRELISTGDPFKILQALGGLEIAAMTGAYIQASKSNIAAIVDGFISGAAALVACKMDPKVARCLFWSHKSAEQGAVLLMEAVRATVTSTGSSGTEKDLNGVIPILDLGLKLGEGTGAVLALPILRSAAAIMSNMAALKDIL
ncbi:putative Nicotinate-nucleotide--dimethylbenzimidazole phosphoribosyltransferase [Nannochloris sp. 'desiccata']|nr:hypothetical protein KSW81_005500 [Chlorella desiccata (nom. nud.)]KAH7621290.1 putative Nicotinate-nucleotide--dimethylbenzimidazole phosphoribosyltransferase [Chlorella desiccata (nom. nud.)]